MEYYEEQIVRGVKEGDENAFRILYDKYYHRLFCISRQYLQDEFLAETIVSDVFFHLWENRKTIDIQISLNAYLIRMVRNFSLNYLHGVVKKLTFFKNISQSRPKALSDSLLNDHAILIMLV